MAAMYQFHAGGVSHRTTSLCYDVANIESRLLRHQSVLQQIIVTAWITTATRSVFVPFGTQVLH